MSALHFFSIQVSFIEHRILHVNMDSPVIFSVVIMCNYNYYLILEFSITPNRNIIPVSSHSQLSSCFTSWQLLIYFLFLWICLFWTFLINGIIQYAVFVSGLFHLSMSSRSIYVVTCILLQSFDGWIRSHCMDTPRFVYSLVNEHLSCFCFLAIMNNVAMHTYI